MSPKVSVLASAKKQGRKVLSARQYLHAIELVKQLADFNDPAAVADLRIEPIEDFYELKDKGGLLGKINLRIYFGYFPKLNEIVVVHVYKKEQECQLPRHIIITVQARIRNYRNGGLRNGMTVYEA